MSKPVPVTRLDKSAIDLRREASRCSDGAAVRRLLAIALVLEGRPMQVDGAGWHLPSERLIVPANITLLTLPPNAPELNPGDGCSFNCARGRTTC